MRTLSVVEKILLHLYEHRTPAPSTTSPMEAGYSFRVTQRGISNRIGVSRGHIAVEIKRLIGKGLVEEVLAHVIDTPRRMKVYRLTPDGLSEAKNLVASIDNMMVKVKVGDEIHDVTLKDANRYLGTECTMIEVLMHTDKDGVVDFTPDRKKDIFTLDFIGRKTELDTLKTLLKRVEKGEGAVVFITGEMGIGKTRLVTELKPYAQSRGFIFLSGRGLYYEETASYLPFIEALRGFEDSEWLKEAETELKALPLRTDSSLLHAETPVDHIHFRHLRSRIFELTTRFFKHVASKKPVVLFLDDLQWADNASLQLLHYLARNIQDSRVLICGTYREEDVPKTSTFSEILGRMKREGLYTDIKLERLNSDCTRLMVQSFFGARRFRAILRNLFMTQHRVTRFSLKNYART